MFLGHKIGLAGCYYKPTEEEMYLEYQKAENNLTINEENRLRKKVETSQIEKSELEKLTADVADLKKMMKTK